LNVGGDFAAPIRHKGENMKNTVYALAAVGLAAVATTAQAGIGLVSGPATLITNTADMKYKADAYQDTTANVNYWTEREVFTLSQDLVISIVPPGSFPTTVTTHAGNESNKIPLSGLVGKLQVALYQPFIAGVF